MTTGVMALVVLSMTVVAAPRLMAASTRTVVGRVVDGFKAAWLGRGYVDVRPGGKAGPGHHQQRQD
jgi:hypothetical protein